MSQIVIKRNKSKRPRIGNHGFKVYKNTKVYIGTQTITKHAPRESTLNLLRDVWNTNKSIKTMRKHIKEISIVRIQPKSGTITLGYFNHMKSKLKVYDCGTLESNKYKIVIIHEIEGHAFWHWAEKWRPEEFKRFNDLARITPPINNYVKSNEDKWRLTGNYENEQHSAISEIVNDCVLSDYHKPIINSDRLEALIKLYKELHY